jgi:hypothetical protein
MNFIERALANVAENIGEGRRWSGRTQSSESRSLEQLQHEYRLQLRSEVLPGNGPVPVSPEVGRYEALVRRDSTQTATR